MRRVWSAIRRILALGVIPELSSEHARQVTQTNGAALCAAVAGAISCVVTAAVGHLALSLLGSTGVAIAAATLAFNARGHIHFASLWLVMAVDATFVGLGVAMGQAVMQTASYFACSLPFLMFSTRQWRPLAAALVVTVLTFIALTWPGLLPGPLAALTASELQALSILGQALTWTALLLLIVGFAFNRDQVSRTLRQTLHKAQAANAAKSAFLAHTSHELRTPMGAILGYADLLLAPGISDQERTDFVRTIRRNGRHLLDLVDQILDHAKIEAGQLEVVPSVCSPERIVADVEALMSVRAAAKGLDLSIEYETRVPELIETDELRVRQILVNLIGNAVKFTSSGVVRLQIALLRTDGKADLQFAVVDQGPGIDAARLPAMFEPFTQADMTTQRTYGGTGLGLAISKELAELLGGRLRAESEIGSGSTFTFTLHLGPVSELGDLVDARVAVETTRVKIRNPCHLADVRILVAEDGLDNQQLMELHLRQVGAECVLTVNGLRAIEAYEQAMADNEPFDIILLDMQMPVMDGYQAARKLRELGCRTPIIALTAHAMIGAREECLEAGCDDYFAKPIDFDALFAVMLEILERQTQPFDAEVAASPQHRSSLDIPHNHIPHNKSAAGPDGAGSPPDDPRAAFSAQLASLTRDFVRRLPENIAELQATVQSGDAERVRFLAHRLRGTAGTFGLDRVSELAGEIMKAVDRDSAGSGRDDEATGDEDGHRGDPWPDIERHMHELADIAAQANLA